MYTIQVVDEPWKLTAVRDVAKIRVFFWGGGCRINDGGYIAKLHSLKTVYLPS